MSGGLRRTSPALTSVSPRIGDPSHGQAPRQTDHHRLRARRLHGGHLCRARHAAAAPHRGHPRRRPDDHHHRRGELSGLRRRDPRPLAHGADARPGRACRHRDHRRPYRRGRPQAPALLAQGRQRHRIHRRHPHHRHRRAGALARASVRRALQGLRRVGLRHLRRLLLPRQEGHRGRRRQHRRRGGALPRQHRRARDPRASARRAARREDPAGAPVQEPEDRNDVERRARRGARSRRPCAP